MNMRSCRGSIAVLTQQISNYHVARYRAAAKAFERLTIISLMNDADFSQFLSSDVSGLDVIRLFNGRAPYMKAVRSGRVWTATQNALDSLLPDAVAVAGWSFPESLGAIEWARRQGVRLVMMSASQRNDSVRQKLREGIKARVVQACDAALVGGAAQEKYITSLGMQPANIFYGYDAVDNDHFAKGASWARANGASERKRCDLPERYLLASARLVPKKNLLRLVEAFRVALSCTRTRHVLLVVGDGPGRAELNDAITSARLNDRVRLLGFKSYHELPTYYGLADAFVHVSLSEQWGLVVNEAAASGLPLIVSRPCGAAAELVKEGVNGTLVDPGNVDDITRALVLMMTASPMRLQAQARESSAIVAAWGPGRFASGLRAAVDASGNHKGKPLSFFDKMLLRVAARSYPSAVA